MTRYFFHLHDDFDAPDDEGGEFPSLKAAREYAENISRRLAGDLVQESGRLVLHHRIDIEDRDGDVLSTVWFSDVVTVERDTCAA